MKKQLLSLIILIVTLITFFSEAVFAAKIYSFEEKFAVPVAQYWGFSSAAGGSINYDATNQLLQMRWGTTSSAVKTLESTIAPSIVDNKITVEMIVKYFTSGSSSNPGCLYFLDENDNAVFGLVFWRNSSQWRIGRATSYNGPGSPTVNPTVADWLGADSPIAKVTAVLDFVNQTVDYSAVQGTFDYSTRIFTPGGATVSSVAQPFLNATTGIKKLYTNYRRVSSATGSYGYDLMYMGISKEENVQTSQVTVKFADQDNNYFKADENIADAVIGSTYEASASQKAAVVQNGFYYVLDPVSPTSVVVDAAGSTLTLKFRKSELNSDLTWNGTTDTNGNLWSDWYQNFLNASNAASAYQSDANVLFSESAANKSVVLNQIINLGVGNVSITSDGFTFNGTGSISGSGKLDVNPGVTGIAKLNITNNQSGGVNVLTGTLEVGKAAAGADFTLADGTRLNLNPDADFSKPITGSGTITINTIANKSYGGTITGASTVNLILGVSGSVASGTNWSSKVTTALPADAQANVSTTLVSAGFAVTSTSLQNSKVNLGAGVRLLHNYNAAIGGTTISVGELSGDALSTVEGGWQNFADRNLNYYIGAANTDATFHGKFLNYGTSILAPLNISKKGTGTWTLTGSSDAWVNGSFNVDDGKVVMNGSIPSTAVPASVASGATLTGTGTIGGPATINGVLEGSLHFGSTLVLAGTTNLTVTGFNTGEFDVLTVTGAVTNGGILNINLLNEPTGTGTIKLIAAPDGAYSGTFTAVNINTLSAPSGVPAAQRAKTAIGYSYDPLTGVLSYTDLGTGISEQNNAAEIYPTLTRGEVYVNAENGRAAEVITTSGQLLRQVKLNAALTTVNLTGLTDGIYLLKIKYNDGTDTTQQIILKK
ncbi:MAG: T9SS type A sorting domain-containing protein [Paludibacteraceae bacterium]